MPVEYIVSIAVGSLFVLLLFIYIIVAVQIRKRNRLRMENLEKMYSDKNLARMDYDCAVYDEETEKIIHATRRKNGQLTIDELMGSEVAVSEETVFQSVEKEGMEEITGTYKPEK